MNRRQVEAKARELFGLDRQEARELADLIRLSGYNFSEITPRSRAVWADAADLLYIEEEETEEEVPAPRELVRQVQEDYEEDDRAYYDSPYALDPSFPGDEYIEAGEEWEIVPDTPS